MAQIYFRNLFVTSNCFSIFSLTFQRLTLTVQHRFVGIFVGVGSRRHRQHFSSFDASHHRSGSQIQILTTRWEPAFYGENIRRKKAAAEMAYKIKIRIARKTFVRFSEKIWNFMRNPGMHLFGFFWQNSVMESVEVLLVEFCYCQNYGTNLWRKSLEEYLGE